MARNKLVKKSYSEDRQSVDFAPTDLPSINAHRSMFTDEMNENIWQYGLGQKIGDSYAFGKGVNGTPQMATDEINAMIAQLVAGDWKAIREEGAPKSGKRVRVIFEMGETGVDDISARRCQKVFGAKLKISEWTLDNVRTAYAEVDDETKKWFYTGSQFLDKAAEMEKRDNANARHDQFA